MKAAFKKGREVVLKDVKLPGLKAGQIRLDVDACGICGTDLQVKPGGAVAESYGHEVAGTVTEVARGVPGISVGMKVVLDSATPCGRCENCRNARQYYCLDKQSFFFIPRFGFAEQMIAPGICAFEYGDLDPAIACIQEPLGVAIDMTTLADIKPGNNVLVMGAGPIGLMALSLARKAGARRVFVTELKSRKRRVALAKIFGADDVIDPTVKPLPEVKFGCGIDRILVSAPPKVLPDAFRVAAEGAIISFIGIEHGAGANVTFDANQFHFAKLQLRASFASPALYGPMAVKYLREKVIDGEALVSHRFPLGRIQEAMDCAWNDPNAVKVVVECR